MKLSKVRYRLASFKDAQLLMSHMEAASRTSARISPHQAEFFVEAEIDFLGELALAARADEIASDFRAGTKYAQDERNYIAKQYLCWHSVSDIARSLRRTESAVCTVLQDAGLFWVPGHYATICTKTSCPVYWHNAILFQDGHALREAGVFTADRGECGPLPLDDLTRDELSHVVAMLYRWAQNKMAASEYSDDGMEEERYYAEEALDIGIRLATQSGLSLEGYHLLRFRADEPRVAYCAMRSFSGLPAPLLYQRAILRAHLTDRTVTEYPVHIAKLRGFGGLPEMEPLGHLKGDTVTTWRARIERPSTATLFGITLQDMKAGASPGAVAFASAHDLDELERLSKSGNRVAAWFLSRHFQFHDGRHWDEELANAQNVCRGYEPEPNEVRHDLLGALDTDAEYAALLDRLKPAWSVQPFRLPGGIRFIPSDHGAGVEPQAEGWRAFQQALRGS
jgi:hypothetical protein